MRGAAADETSRHGSMSSPSSVCGEDRRLREGQRDRDVAREDSSLLPSLVNSVRCGLALCPQGLC